MLKVRVLVVGQLSNTACVSNNDTDPNSGTDCATTNTQVSPKLTVNPNGPYTVAEGSTIQLMGSGTRSDGTTSGLIYSWDLDGNGTFETSGPNPVFSAMGMDGLFAPLVQSITVKLCDGLNCVTRATTVSITNVPPRMTSVTNDGLVVVGVPVTITVTATDVAGALDPLGYEFDCDNNGIYETGPQAGNTAPCSFATPGLFSVNVRVTDGDGGSDVGTTTVTVVSFSYPAFGQFAIGDLAPHAIGQSVTFWGPQWNSTNPTSVGPGTSAFKGFTDTGSVPTCGSVWTTSPGNSAKPPNTIPAYMAVIVTSKVEKAGPSISGDMVQIVIVKTNPGYGANPAQAGTGTVVAVLCRN